MALALLCQIVQPVTGWGAEAKESAAHGARPLATANPGEITNIVVATSSVGDTETIVTTNSTALKERLFRWKSSWRGWDGLHLELTRKTPLGLLLPSVTNLEHLNLEKRADEALFGKSLAPGTNAHGLYLGESSMTATIGGKLAVDGAAYQTGKQFNGFDNDVEVRRARLYAKGDCLLVFPVSYQIEVGYIPDEFYIEESYLLWRDVGLFGDLKLGQFQAPMSLEGVTSSRDVTFMELAAPVQALAPGVDAGFQMGRPVLHERATCTWGLFSQGVGRDYGDASENYARAIARVTGLPIYESNPDQPNSTRLLHLGLSANTLYSANSSVRYQTRPESHLAPYVVDTGVIRAQGALVAGAEVAWVEGPFSVQGEYLHSWVRQNNGPVLNFDGLYTSVSWFLTGETRPYDRQKGCFARVIPRRNFDWGKGGWGAWEIAARYSFVNLDSEDIQGGRLSMLTTGVNWYLHPHMKWRFDYGFGHVADHQPEGNLNILQTRIELDF